MSQRDLVILGSSSQQPTRARSHGAYLLRWNEEGFLFDPGEGTQRQFIFANVTPTTVTRILISHFHGDHCLGLGSMLMRLNLDKVTHPIHCYYPASGKVYFDRLRYGSIYRENITVIEHPIEKEGKVHEDENFTIEAFFLEHGVENLGYRVREADRRRFDKEKLKKAGIEGPRVRDLEKLGKLTIDGKTVSLDDVSWLQPGDLFAYVSDTRMCREAVQTAHHAKLFLCESTYLERDRTLAEEHHHLTAKQAAEIAKSAQAKMLILTHFSARYQDLEEFLREARAVFPETYVAEDFKTFPFKK